MRGDRLLLGGIVSRGPLSSQLEFGRHRSPYVADDIAARLPNREGLVFGDARYTFREIAARIDEAARRLIAAGVGHGEHVALWLNNCDDWIFIAFAVQKIGAVLVPAGIGQIL